MSCAALNPITTVVANQLSLCSYFQGMCILVWVLELAVGTDAGVTFLLRTRIRIICYMHRVERIREISHLECIGWPIKS